MSYINTNIPFFYAGLDTGFLYDQDPSPDNEKVPVEVFAYASIPQRCGLFSVMTEWGTQHARVPLHYLTSTDIPVTTNFPLHFLELWDNFSPYVSCTLLDYCKNRAVEIFLKDKTMHKAQYMFTLDWCLGPDYTSGYGEMPAGHKQAHMFVGEGGQFFMQPNNRILWRDGGAFITKSLGDKPDWMVFSQTFSVEHEARRWTTVSDDEVWFYEFKEMERDNG